MKRYALLTSLTVALGLSLIFACRDTTEITDPSQAVAAAQVRVTITGLGTGNGVVTSVPSGINCTITAGKAAATGCSKLFNQNINVTLTAKPAAGHSFVTWGSPCSGNGTCRVWTSTNRTVSAQFMKGPFTINISGGNPGGGNGRVTSQTGLTPRIDCTLTNGTPAATGCSARYPANTVLTLTATPASGWVFDGWREPGCGTGNCQIKVIQNKTVAAPFIRAPATSAATQGRWDPTFSTPVVAVHVHQLTTGKVLLWGDKGDAQLWGPTTGFTPVKKTYRIYCSGHTYLPDGRLLVVGGTSPDTRGLRYATIYNPATNSWTQTSNMAQGRYYPTNTTLANGDILAISGHDTALSVVTIPEVWNGASWRRLTTAPLSIPNPFYPPMFVAPNGKVFLAGFTQPSQYLDVNGTGRWTPVANRVVADRVLGTAVMYAPGKVLYAGGGNGKPWDLPPTASAEVIDLNQPSPAWRSVPSMAFGRKQLNATILADGKVLVTGGTSGPGFNSQGGAVHTAELWDPVTETWKTMASETRNRTYHATAILLPNGRVMSSGSGEGGDVPYVNSEFTAQIYSPPYLFNANGTAAARPTISSAPARLAYGQSFTVQTPNAATVKRGNLIRLSSVTHAFNMSQLLYPVTFTAAGSNTLSAVAPPNGNLAPPGPYMLFLINDAGVPSVAKFVTIGP
jgi:hypothetical protein